MTIDQLAEIAMAKRETPADPPEQDKDFEGFPRKEPEPDSEWDTEQPQWYTPSWWESEKGQ